MAFLLKKKRAIVKESFTQELTLPAGCFFLSFSFFFFFLFFGRFHLLIFREGEGREKEGEKHQCAVASHMPLTGDLARNPGMCPDWESNW